MKAKRIMIKIGTKVLNDEQRNLDKKHIQHIVKQISTLKKQGLDIIFVTSGAVAAGRARLKDIKDNSTLNQQLFAAVGQVDLMKTYSDLFAKYSFTIAQVLVTKEDFRDREHYFHMRNCIEGLLHEKVIPIVNENDVTATGELLFTDNDELTGLLASMINAEQVVILSSVDGFMEGNKLIPEIDFTQGEEYNKFILKEKTAGGRGGMETKFNIARKLSAQGIETIIANGRNQNILIELVNGAKHGTRFVANKKINNTKRRIAYVPTGSNCSITVNECTEELLLKKETTMSLLPIGVVKVVGEFIKGDTVVISGPSGKTLGVGIVSYDSSLLNKYLGKKNQKEIIHYDKLYID